MYIDSVSLPGVPASQSEQERIHLLGTVRTVFITLNKVKSFNDDLVYINIKAEIKGPLI